MALRSAGRTALRRRGRGKAAKIVVTGPFAAGKTTLIRTISEITVLSTERGISDETSVRKRETTVAMDFGRIGIDSDLVLYLFGTPGQDRFEFMWEVLGEGMFGYVLVVDGDRAESPEEARSILDAFRKMAKVPFVVAVNRRESTAPIDEDRLRSVLELEADVPVMPVDATDKASVKEVLLTLLHHILDRHERVAVGA
jgi:small GTP-binding protein